MRGFKNLGPFLKFKQFFSTAQGHAAHLPARSRCVAGWAHRRQQLDTSAEAIEFQLAPLPADLTPASQATPYRFGTAGLAQALSAQK